MRNFRAYPLVWATHTAARAAATGWQRRGLLTPEQSAAIAAAYPLGYYRPSVFLRVGLFLFTWFGLASSGLLFGWIFELGGVELGLALLAALCVGALEWAIRDGRHYRSGFDNALLYCALGAVAALLSLLINKFFPAPAPVSARAELLLLALLLPVLLLALLRYADPLVAAATYAVALALLAKLLLFGSAGRLLLPFVGVAVGAGLHAWLGQLPKRPDYPYYQSAIWVLRVLALATTYLAGNYLVVREGNAALLGEAASGEIPFAAPFWVFTALIPLIYLGLGLRRHDRLLLGLGVLALGFSVFTLRHYHAVLPPAWAATLAGAALVAGTLLALRYLRQPRHGLTAAADAAAPPAFDLEAFAVAQTVELPTAPAPGFEFGGGQSGGGGATGSF